VRQLAANNCVKRNRSPDRPMFEALLPAIVLQRKAVVYAAQTTMPMPWQQCDRAGCRGQERSTPLF
jgi:hypothetical protein